MRICLVFTVLKNEIILWKIIMNLLIEVISYQYPINISNYSAEVLSSWKLIPVITLKPKS